MKAIENHDDFISLLYQEPTISTHFSKETIQSWIVPENNIEESLAKVDDVVSTVQVYFRGD